MKIRSKIRHRFRDGFTLQKGVMEFPDPVPAETMATLEKLRRRRFVVFLKDEEAPSPPAGPNCDPGHTGELGDLPADDSETPEGIEQVTVVQSKLDDLPEPKEIRERLADAPDSYSEPSEEDEVVDRVDQAELELDVSQPPGETKAERRKRRKAEKP